MNDYTYSDILQMQDQAIARAREMHKRAQFTAGLADEAPEPVKTEPQVSERAREGAQNPQPKNRHIPMPVDYLSFKDRSEQRERALFPNERHISEREAPLFKSPLEENYETLKENESAKAENLSERVHSLENRPGSAIKNLLPKGLSSLLGGISFDGDQIMLIALLLLLSSEEADQGLILAIMYIML